MKSFAMAIDRQSSLIMPKSSLWEVSEETACLQGTGSRKSDGFTLVELLITIAIIGILTAIAIPSYQLYLIKSRRIDATSTLTQIQLAEEKYRGNNLGYATLTQLGLTPSSSYYSFTVTSSGDDYTLLAKAIGNQVMDTMCPTLAISQSSTGISQTPANCWK